MPGYKILFHLKILHAFFLDKGEDKFGDLDENVPAEAAEKLKRLSKYNISRFLQIQPDAETIPVLKGQKMIFKQVTNGFIVAVETDAAQPLKPLIPIESGLNLRFFIRPLDPFFSSYTMLPWDSDFRKSQKDFESQKIYFFTNKNKSGDTKFLAAQPLIFDADLADDANGVGKFAYLPGELIRDDADNPTKVFECIQSTNASPPDAAIWTDRGADFGWVSRADQWTVSAPDLRFEIAAGVGEVTAKVFNFETTQLLLEKSFVSSELEKKEVSVSIEKLPSGRYEFQLVKNDDDSVLNRRIFYFDEYIRRNAVWAAVEIKSAVETTGYALLNPEGELVSPVFLIKLGNRRTIWQYFHHADKSLQTVANTDQLLPLTESGLATALQLNTQKLPNAEPRFMRLKKIGGKEQLVSEILIDKMKFQP